MIFAQTSLLHGLHYNIYTFLMHTCSELRRKMSFVSSIARIEMRFHKNFTESIFSTLNEYCCKKSSSLQSSSLKFEPAMREASPRYVLQRVHLIEILIKYNTQETSALHYLTAAASMQTTGRNAWLMDLFRTAEPATVGGRTALQMEEHIELCTSKREFSVLQPNVQLWTCEP